jgi:hypothetical protein
MLSIPTSQQCEVLVSMAESFERALAYRKTEISELRIQLPLVH